MKGVHLKQRSRVLITAAVLAIVALAAPAAAAPVVLTGPELTAGLLAPEDVPGGGWVTAPSEVIEPEPHIQSTADTPAFAKDTGGWCGGGPTVGVTPGAVTTLQKVVSPDEPYWFIWEALFSFDQADGLPPAGHAKAFVNAEQGYATGCESWTTSGGEITNSISGVVVPFAAVGKQRVAIEVTTFGDGVSELTHVVYVRVKNHVVVVHTRILPSDTALLTQIVKKATKKLKQAVAAAA